MSGRVALEWARRKLSLGLGRAVWLRIPMAVETIWAEWWVVGVDHGVLRVVSWWGQWRRCGTGRLRG